MLKKIVWCVLVFGCLSTTVSAQTSPATSFVAKYYNVGAPSPVQSDSFQAAATVCNQTAPTVVDTTTPTRIVWNDSANAGKVCIYTTPVGSNLRALPIGGTFEGTLTGVNSVGSGPESARVGFFSTRPAGCPVGTPIYPVRIELNGIWQAARICQL